MAQEFIYYPDIPPEGKDNEARQLSFWVEGELQKVAASFSETPFIRLTELNVEPEKPRDGLVVYADGTDWDPGSGEGVYARIAGAWVKL